MPKPFEDIEFDIKLTVSSLEPIINTFLRYGADTPGEALKTLSRRLERVAKDYKQVKPDPAEHGLSAVDPDMTTLDNRIARLVRIDAAFAFPLERNWKAVAQQSMREKSVTDEFDEILLNIETIISDVRERLDTFGDHEAKRVSSHPGVQQAIAPRGSNYNLPASGTVESPKRDFTPHEALDEWKVHLIALAIFRNPHAPPYELEAMVEKMGPDDFEAVREMKRAQANEIDWGWTVPRNQPNQGEDDFGPISEGHHDEHTDMWGRTKKMKEDEAAKKFVRWKARWSKPKRIPEDYEKTNQAGWQQGKSSDSNWDDFWKDPRSSEDTEPEGDDADEAKAPIELAARRTSDGQSALGEHDDQTEQNPDAAGDATSDNDSDGGVGLYDYPSNPATPTVTASSHGPHVPPLANINTNTGAQQVAKRGSLSGASNDENRPPIDVAAMAALRLDEGSVKKVSEREESGKAVEKKAADEPWWE